MVFKFPAFSIVYLLMALVLKPQKPRDRKKHHNTHYDSLYDILLYLSYYPIPLTKYRISTNKNVLSSLISKQLIHPVHNKDLLINNKYQDVTHYAISPKGIEYIKRYESFKQLFV
jgi:predicted transcriptional regulator